MNKQPKLVEVVLTADHTHKNKRYVKGAKIEVTERQRDWLVSQNLIAGATSAAAK